MTRFFVLSLGFAIFSSAYAVEPDEPLSDAVMEQRARALSQQLRCLVCQNESIDESQAPLARDLRLLLRQKIRAGASDQDIKKWFVERYGQFIMLEPPWRYDTYLLWLAPFVMLVIGSIIIIRFLQKRPRL